MSDPLARLRDLAAVRTESGMRRVLRPRPAGGDGLLDLASNDYLGLARDPRVVEAGVSAARAYGAGSTGSRLVTGSLALHDELAAALASHTGASCGLVFSSGYLANLGAVAALAGPGVLVVSDAQNHASIVDACRLSRSRVVVVPHRSPADVEAALSSRTESAAIVVTDAVFSVDGDLAPLAELHAVARRQGALLVVDEAHSLGVVGDSGRGAAHAAGLAGCPDVVLTLTLSKSLGSQGGAVLADPAVIEHLTNAARAFIYDTALAPAAAGAALRAVQVLSEEPDRVAAVRARALDLHAAVTDAGWPSLRPDAAVVAAIVGEPAAALAAATACAEHGVRVGCFRPPSVPDGQSRLRLTARADLSDAEVELAHLALRAAAAVPTR
ncbi:MAG: 8-amino-7-oxononanoate synthase [Frankiales bacterium]|nr:8-amino-7-oxononanoate synthase [Frankiales bacterium]